jgi:hypothetical protein
LIKVVLQEMDQPEKLGTVSAENLELLSLLLTDFSEQKLVFTIWSCCSAKRRKVGAVVRKLLVKHDPTGRRTSGRIDTALYSQLQQLWNVLAKVIFTFLFLVWHTFV